jgi:hypothetical protein
MVVPRVLFMELRALTRLLSTNFDGSKSLLFSPRRQQVGVPAFAAVRSGFRLLIAYQFFGFTFARPCVFGEGTSPKVFEPARRKLTVANRVLDIAVPEMVLAAPGVVALVRQSVQSTSLSLRAAEGEAASSPAELVTAVRPSYSRRSAGFVSGWMAVHGVYTALSAHLIAIRTVRASRSRRTTRRRHFAVAFLRVLNVRQKAVEKTAAAHLLRYGWQRFVKNFHLDFFCRLPRLNADSPGRVLRIRLCRRG